MVVKSNTWVCLGSPRFTSLTVRLNLPACLADRPGSRFKLIFSIVMHQSWGNTLAIKVPPPCHCEEPRMPWSYKKQKRVDSGSLLRIWGPLTAYLIATYGNSTFLGQAKRGPLEYELIGTGISSDRFRHLRPACGAQNDAPVLCIRKKCIHSSMSSLAKQSPWQPRPLTISYIYIYTYV